MLYIMEFSLSRLLLVRTITLQVLLLVGIQSKTIAFQQPRIVSTTKYSIPQQQYQRQTNNNNMIIRSSHEQRIKRSTTPNNNIVLFMSDKEWAKVLYENSGESIAEEDKKMKGFLKGSTENNPKITANTKLVEWLEQEGNVYLSEQSNWGEAPHLLAISTETVDEITNENSGRGLLARKDITEGALLLNVPMKLCFTKAAARKALGEDVIQSGMNEYLAIALHLIYEKFVQGDNSYYKPFIDILPTTEEVSPTFTWPESDLQFLQGSPVIAASISLQMKLQREYDALLGNEHTGWIAKDPIRFNPQIFTYDNWVWAFTMLFSRAIRLRNMKNGETLAMVPYADLINHSPFSQAYIDARLTGDWLFKTGDEEVVLFAERSYRRMEQVYISYGPKSNAELLLLYGFAAERNPYNSVDVTVSLSRRKKTNNSNNNNDDDRIDDDPLAEEKIKFLESVGRENTVDFPCYADRYPIEMLEYLRLMQMTEQDTCGKSLNEFDYTRAISTANEAAVYQSVIRAVQDQLNKYPQTEEEDATIIKDKTLFRMLTYNQRMAIRHRRNEKRLLKRTIAALEKQMEKQGLVIRVEDNNNNVQQSLTSAQGNTLGTILPGDGQRKQRTALEDRLEKLGLPIDLR